MPDAKRVRIADLVPGVMERDVRVVRWPGTTAEVGLMLLRSQELLEAHLDAREKFRRAGLAIVDAASFEELEAEVELQYCYRMLIGPDSKRAQDRLFKDADECRRALSRELRNHFVREHLALQDEVARRQGILREEQGETR